MLITYTYRAYCGEHLIMRFEEAKVSFHFANVGWMRIICFKAHQVKYIEETVGLINFDVLLEPVCS